MSILKFLLRSGGTVIPTHGSPWSILQKTARRSWRTLTGGGRSDRKEKRKKGWRKKREEKKREGRKS